MNKPRRIAAREVMKDDFILLDGLATVKEGIDKLLSKNAHVLFVDKRNSDDEYGIVVLPDIAAQVIAPDKSPERVNLYEIMTKPMISVDPDMDIRYVAKLFSRFGLSVGPVVEKQAIIGVISYNELVLHGLLEDG